MDRLLTLQEMADYLSVSAQTFRREVKAKSIPHILVGKRPRFDPDRVQAYLLATPETVSKVVQLKLGKPRRKAKPFPSRFATALNGNLS